MTIKKVAVIGAGFSGLMTAVHLSANAGFQISLTGTENDFGKGVAYTLENDAFLLNVPAVAMGAFPDKPEDFYNWLKSQQYQYEEADFVPRRLYGEYLLSVLDSARKNAKSDFTAVRKKVSSVHKSSEDKLQVIYEDSSSDSFDLIVLALGFPRQKFSLLNPHQESSYADIKSAQSIALVGSGLTAVDVIERCRQEGYKGHIHVISRSARFPHPHAKSTAPADGIEADLKISTGENLRTVARKLRKTIRKYGIEAALDPLRAVTNSIWCAFSDKDKQIFYRHLESRWNRVRHRMPPKGYEYIQSLIKEGRLIQHAGSFNSVDEDSKCTVFFTKNKTESSISVDKAFDCRGPSPSARHHPLVQQMAADNLLKIGALGRGIETDLAGKVPESDIYVVGPYRREQLLESTAVRELRQQVQEVAKIIFG